MAYTKKEIKDIAITAPITGYVSTPGTLAPTDTVLQAFNKLNGNQIVNNLTLNQRINSAAANFSQSII